MSDQRTQLVLHILVIYNAFEFFPDQEFFFLKKKLECHNFKWLEIGGKKGLRFLHRIFCVIEMYDIHSDVNKVDPVCIN